MRGMRWVKVVGGRAGVGRRVELGWVVCGGWWAQLERMRFDDSHLKCRCASVEADLIDMCEPN